MQWTSYNKKQNITALQNRLEQWILLSEQTWRTSCHYKLDTFRSVSEFILRKTFIHASRVTCHLADVQITKVLRQDRGLVSINPFPRDSCLGVSGRFARQRNCFFKDGRYLRLPVFRDFWRSCEKRKKVNFLEKIPWSVEMVPYQFSLDPDWNKFLKLVNF